MYIKETDKYYEKLEDAFKEYLKEHNCETCGKHCAAWLHIGAEKESTTTCTRWTPKPCDHNYVSLDYLGATHILFKCTKCDSMITYKKV